MSKSRLSNLLMLMVFALIIGASHQNLAIAQTPEPPLNWIRAVAWSPDSTRLATANLNGAVQIWDATGQQPLLTLKEPDTEFAVSAAWSPDGNKLASGGDGTLYIWDINTGELLLTPDVDKDGYAVSAAWSPDSSKLAVVWFAGSPNNFWILDGKTGERLLKMQSVVDMYYVDWSPTSDLIATAGSNQIQIWNPNLAKAQEMFGEGDEMVSVRWSPDGSQVAGANNYRIRTWDVTTGELINRFIGHEDYTGEIDWSPDGTMLASTSDDNTIRIWDTTTGETLHIIETTTRPLTVAWSPAGTHIAYGGEDMMFEIIAVSDLD
ncbi:MAG: WD40 repeat domain-containing protein [Anaerolineae bacterium]|nr:WD40 repeat domain-containing protein [Anaerolineae bacterium]